MFHDVCLPFYLLFILWCTSILQTRVAVCFRHRIRENSASPATERITGNKRGEGRGNVKGGGEGIEGHAKGAFYCWQRF